VDPRAAVIDRSGLDALINTLNGRGYRVVGPVVRDGAIVYDDVTSVADLPAGVADEQDGGIYRLHPRADDALFGYAVGPHSWKRELFPPRSRMWSAERTESGFEVHPDVPSGPPLALLAVRSCELAAIAIQDRVLRDGAHPDPLYTARRSAAFIVAVNCGSPAASCFCASMATGPRATAGYDLALTELVEADRHVFLVEIGSDAGAAVLAGIPHGEAGPADRAAAVRVTDTAASAMRRAMHPDARDVLAAAARGDHPHWDEVATRCLACGNCTMACPTCFCTTVEDTSDLSGDHAERWRSWDSCFTVDFSTLGGVAVRGSTRSRYRQWLTHKLSTWWDQFDSSGCVGCGRCITWCPVGIDLTEEVRALAGRPGAEGPR
jgi:formate hydrogenlyase subunit 6/NADH:ubiquinone oxidoreductase subunit I